MENFPFVSIIIPAYNHKFFVHRAVESLLRQDYPLEHFEIIVVDDGSTDGTGECVARLKKTSSTSIKYFFQENKGPAAARNRGIQNSKGSIVVFLDADCVASENWLTEIVRGYHGATIAGIGGRTKALPAASLVSRYCAHVSMNETPLIDETGVVYVITGNASFQKRALIEVGGFDERFDAPGGEDPDICRRLKERGYAFCYNRKAVVYNRHKESLGALWKTYYNYGRGYAYMMLRSTSSWDLFSASGLKRFLNFIKICARMLPIVLESLKFIPRFFRIPLKAAFYYGEGVSAQCSIAYAFFDYAKGFAYNQGMLIGYFQGKIKGFKKDNTKGCLGCPR